MLPTLAAGIASVRRRRWLQSWVEALGRHGQLALFASGAAVLAVRALERWESREALALLAAALLAVPSAIWVARRRRPSAARAAAWLDVQGGARGLVVTESELGASAWSPEARIELARALTALPRPDWRRAAKRLAPAALFAALAVWIPVPRVDIGPPPVLAEAALEELEQELATLEGTLELSPEVAAELEARLERIQAEADQGRPESTFEALDRLEERIAAETARALEAARDAGADLARAAGDPSLAEAQSALEQALASLDRGGLAGQLPPEVESALQPGSLSLPQGVQLSSAELAQLSQALKGVLDERLAKLGAGGLLSGLKLSELGLEPGELASLADFDPTHACDEECKQPGGT